MTLLDTHNHFGSQTPFSKAANQSITVDGVSFAYRDVGPKTGVPLVLFNHWGAVLDNFDPGIIDELAKKRRVITTDYRGIGGSEGSAPLTVGEMADDAIGLIRALGVDKADLLGFFIWRIRRSRHRPQGARTGAPTDPHGNRSRRGHRH